jgi:hypothetical protein
VRYVARHLPLESLHKDAFKGQGDSCARDQGKYWDARSPFATSATRPAGLAKHAQGSGDMGMFERCIAGGTRTRYGRTSRRPSGCRSAPTFLIALEPEQSRDESDEAGRAQPYSAFKSIIDGLLAAPK